MDPGCPFLLGQSDRRLRRRAATVIIERAEILHCFYQSKIGSNLEQNMGENFQRVVSFQLKPKKQLHNFSVAQKAILHIERGVRKLFLNYRKKL